MLRPLISFLTIRGWKTRGLAREFNLSFIEAFDVVRTHGGVEGARRELIKRQKSLQNLTSSLWSGSNRYERERPQNTYTSGSRLSS